MSDIASERLWHVSHVRPRCEKKLAQYCELESIECSLPLFKSPKQYQGKKVIFLKPLFPGYLFILATERQRRLVQQNKYSARLLTVPDQQEFETQLGDILRALETEREVRLAPEIREGQRVKVKYGPLSGLEGLVEKRAGIYEVVLRLDFISQCAAVKMTADELELA